MLLLVGIIHLFIHSGHFYSAPFKSFTTQRRPRLQHEYCIEVSRRSAQETAGKGLAQGPCSVYVTARAGGEPTPLRLRVIASTNAPSRPITSRNDVDNSRQKRARDGLARCLIT